MTPSSIIRDVMVIPVPMQALYGLLLEIKHIHVGIGPVEEEEEDDL